MNLQVQIIFKLNLNRDFQEFIYSVLSVYVCLCICMDVYICLLPTVPLCVCVFQS